MKLLVVDDDRALRDVLRRALTLNGYEVSLAESGGSALSQVTAQNPDAMVLDIGLPDIDGLDVCGADDYLVKPFDIDELKARIRALMRRAATDVSEPDGLSFGELKIDSGRHGVWVGEQFAELTRTEYQLLELLMRNPRRVLPHTMIYDRVWGYDFGPTSNALRVYVGYLRRKLEDAGSRPLIHTVRGVGYALREPEE
jgi:two-component system response regulator MprA